MNEVPLRTVFAVVNGGTPTSDPENWDGDVPWATPVDLAAVNGAVLRGTQRTITAHGVKTGSALIPSGSLIVSTRAPIGYAAETSTPTAFNQGCRGLVPRGDVDIRFFRYQMAAAVDRLQARGQGSTFMELSTDALASFPLFAPSHGEQRAVANYLDAETASIDATLTALRQSLRLTGERRKSLIMSAFRQGARATRGTTVRALADPLLGRQRSPDQAQGPHMVPYLRAANVKDGRLDLDDIKEMNFDPGEQVIFALRPGDVLITEGAGSLAAVGANAVWQGELSGTICFQNTLIRLRPRPSSDPRFVAWWARYAFESGLLAAAAGGANIYHLGVETVRGLPAWAPSIDIQRQVALELDRDVSRLERQATMRRRQIDLLLERRHALITAAVTGQAEIPEVAA